ncbi:hypothetical protein [Methanosarcina sp.]|uniref:hypothetical protein n=1 Tax=Methanosarcina sp. TaxID=2213 RepID=UPI003C77795C
MKLPEGLIAISPKIEAPLKSKLKSSPSGERQKSRSGQYADVETVAASLAISLESL